jgi:hypothetical protein
MSFTASLEAIVAENANGLLSKNDRWPRVRLGEVASILNGYPFESSRFSRQMANHYSGFETFCPETQRPTTAVTSMKRMSYTYAIW